MNVSCFLTTNRSGGYFTNRSGAGTKLTNASMPTRIRGTDPT